MKGVLMKCVSCGKECNKEDMVFHAEDTNKPKKETFVCKECNEQLEQEMFEAYGLGGGSHE